MAATTAASERSKTATYASPALECDLVMKGGISSGIVYPPAVLELAEKYRFRSIGGTSAGAIAAVVTAAAEFGRERGGFEKLKGLNDWLASDDHLRDLFQPSREAQPLLELLLQTHRRATGRVDPQAAQNARAKKKPFLPAWARFLFVVLPGALRTALPWTYWIWTALGLFAGGWVDWTLACGLVDLSHPVLRIIVALVLPVGFVGAYVASIAACGFRLWKILSDVSRRQFFGICTGLATPERPQVPTLTNWLHERIQDLAGLPEQAAPLTVGMLKAKRGTESDADYGIELRTITTCLSLGQPYVLPIEDELFIFKTEDMARLFPEPVVRHLAETARKTPRLDLSKLPGYHVLPASDDIPVLVLARMSLSFPVLLSAVPLYVVNRDAFERNRVEQREPTGAPRPVVVLESPESDLQRTWFSDGGITSNFPIHFFDAWLPSRPTFGMNLASLPRPTSIHGHDAARGGPRSVFLPAPSRMVYPPQADIVSLLEFLGAMGSTAQNFRDNTLAALPSYRERIVQIRLSDHEGGLNLAMGPDAIKSVIDKGKTAGELLSTFDFDQHRWVRFLVFMAQFERQLLHLGKTLQKSQYDLLIKEGVGRGFAYVRDDEWRAEALERLRLLEGYIARVEERQAAWRTESGSAAGETFFDLNSPKPEGVLRVTPRT